MAVIISSDSAAFLCLILDHHHAGPRGTLFKSILGIKPRWMSLPADLWYCGNGFLKASNWEGGGGKLLSCLSSGKPQPEGDRRLFILQVKVERFYCFTKNKVVRYFCSALLLEGAKKAFRRSCGLLKMDRVCSVLIKKEDRCSAGNR